jgi:hypothetical protein
MCHAGFMPTCHAYVAVMRLGVFDDFRFGGAAFITIERVNLQPGTGRMRLDDGKGRCPATKHASLVESRNTMRLTPTPRRVSGRIHLEMVVRSEKDDAR